MSQGWESFDAFMALTLPLWMAWSLACALMVAALLFRAAFRIKKLRLRLEEATRSSGLQKTQGNRSLERGPSLAVRAIDPSSDDWRPRP